MRQLIIFCTAIMLPVLAAGQVTVISGYAMNSTPPGLYAQPFVPLLSTPAVSFENVSPSPVGASNATAGNVAGATNATLSITPAGPVAQFVESVAVGTPNASIKLGGEAEARVEAGSRVEVESSVKAESRMEIDNSKEVNSPAESRPLELGVALFEDSYGAAQLAAASPTRQPAKRLYTNVDLEQMNQVTGTVKYDGKTEGLQ